MRKIALLLCLLMFGTAMSGCLGGSDVETSEGDDVVLEDTDDWPTYYVQTASDLPTCDASTPANLGRLYYVEADTNFQACMSTGWQVVQLGGSGSTLVLNQAPVIAAAPNCGHDGTSIASDGDSTFTLYCTLSWSGLDVDGTIASIGVDHDLDGIIDINLPSDSGKDMTSPAAHAGFDGMLGVPLEDGTTYTKHESYRDRPGCVITLMKTVNFIVIDDDGAKTILPSIFQAEEFNNETDSVWFSAFGIDSVDIDWLLGVGTSPCGLVPTFTFADHGDAVTDSSGDNLVVVTMTSGSFDLAPSSVEFSIIVTWESSNTGGYYYWNDVMTANQADPNLAQAGDSWVISAQGDYCSNGSPGPQSCTGNVKVRISYEGEGWTFSHHESMQLA